MALNKFTKVILLLSVLIICSCSNSAEQEYGVNTKQIEDAFASARQMTGLKSLIVEQKGNIIKEEYFGTASADQENDIRSVTKSVTALLIGIAIDKGYIKSLDQNISEFIAPLVSTFPTDKSGLTIRHLITMSGGFQGNELTDPNLYSNWASVDDRVSYILNVPLIYEPGVHFSYDSRPYHLLSVILTQATGMSTKEFAERYLFSPLAIGSRNWLIDRQGFFVGSAGLYLTGRDMIKIGKLILNDGTYNGSRLVSSDWIAQLKQTKISTQNAVSYGTGYSYGFWLGNYNNKNFVFAMGWGGQFIIIVPSLELVITAANSWSELSDTAAGQRWQSTIDLIMTRILTAFN